jgi:hypothetical protein
MKKVNAKTHNKLLNVVPTKNNMTSMGLSSL